MGDVVIFPHWRLSEIRIECDEPAKVFVLPYAPRELQASEQEAIVDLRKIEALFSREAYNAFGAPPVGWLDHPNCRCTITPLMGNLDEIVKTLEDMGF